MDIDDLMADDEEYRGMGQPGRSSRISMDEFSDLFEETDTPNADSGTNAGESDESKNAHGDDGRTLIGTVERFFSKIKVAAISVTGDISIGDTLMISGDNGDLTLTVLQMQIDKANVESAGDGDSIGIKVERAVSPGSRVYRLATRS